MAAITRASLVRFGELKLELIFDKFKRLQEFTTVELYFDEFEKCRRNLLNKIPSLTREYFLENFIGGLKSEIRSMFRLLEPSTLEQALKLARFYEHSHPSQPKEKKNNSWFTQQLSCKVNIETTGASGSYKPALLTPAKIT